MRVKEEASIRRVSAPVEPSATSLAYGLLIVFATFSFLPRVRANVWAFSAFVGTALILFLGLLWALHQAKRNGKN